MRRLLVLMLVGAVALIGTPAQARYAKDGRIDT
jgi:hypothetical protein